MSIIIEASETPDDIFQAVRERIEANRRRLLESLAEPPMPAENGPRPERLRAGGATGAYVRREPSGSQSICFRIATALLEDVPEGTRVWNASKEASTVLATALDPRPADTDSMFDGSYPWPDLPGFANPGGVDFFPDIQGRLWLKAFRIDPETNDILEEFFIDEHELLGDELTIRDRTITKYSGGDLSQVTLGLPVRQRTMLVAQLRQRTAIRSGTIEFSTGYQVDGNATTLLNPDLVYIRYRPIGVVPEDIIFLATGPESSEITAATTATACAVVSPAAVRGLATPGPLTARLEYLAAAGNIEGPWDAAPFFGVDPQVGQPVTFYTAGVFRYLREDVAELPPGDFGELVSWLSNEAGWPPRVWIRHRAGPDTDAGAVVTETGLLFRSQAGRATYTI